MALSFALLALASSFLLRTAAADVQCPRDNGTVLNQADGTQYTILCGYDLYDPNAENYTVEATFQDCIDQCGSSDWDDDCWGVVWVSTGQKYTYCYQKPLVAPATVATANVQAAKRLPSCPMDNGM